MAGFVCAILSLALLTCLNVCPSLGSQVPSVSVGMSLKYANLSDECLQQLITFAERTSSFTKCVITNAQPIRLCENCTIHHKQVVESYEDILKVENHLCSPLALQINSSKKENCRDVLINIDRLQVVSASYDYVKDMWDNASCSLCLNSDGTDLNERTTMIKNLESSLTNCNDTTHNNSLSCVECRPTYLNLTNYYDKHKNKEGFCMDIVDLVNKTQITWGKMCHDVNGDFQWTLLIISFIMLLLPILFYLTNWHSYRGGYSLLPENRYRNQSLTNNVASTSGYVAIS